MKEHLMIILSVTEFLSDFGYYGLLGGTFLSSLFLPIGSDLIFIGMLAAGFDPWACLVTATLGNWLGGLIPYSISYAGNPEKIEKWLKIKPETIARQKIRVSKFGSLLALIVWIPVIGDASNIALGFYRTTPVKTIILMFIGRMCRFLVWIILYLIYKNRFVEYIDRL